MGEELSDVTEIAAMVEFNQVLLLSRSNRKTLGLPPDEGFLQRAEKGTLLARAPARS